MYACFADACNNPNSKLRKAIQKGVRGSFYERALWRGLYHCFRFFARIFGPPRVWSRARAWREVVTCICLRLRANVGDWTIQSPSAGLSRIQISNPSKSRITFLFRLTSKKSVQLSILCNLLFASDSFQLFDILPAKIGLGLVVYTCTPAGSRKIFTAPMLYTRVHMYVWGQATRQVVVHVQDHGLWTTPIQWCVQWLFMYCTIMCSKVSYSTAILTSRAGTCFSASRIILATVHFSSWLLFAQNHACCQCRYVGLQPKLRIPRCAVQSVCRSVLALVLAAHDLPQ